MSDNDDDDGAKAGDIELPGLKKPRSTSLKEALRALETGGGRRTAESMTGAGEEAQMNDEDSPKPAMKAAADIAQRAKTKVFGGGSEELKYYQEPVVGWLVVVGGPGLGAFRPIFMGSNTLGADPGQRIPIDFGDEYISKEEQAYIRYDADDRQFLFIPNLAKTNVVSIDNVKPTAAVRLQPYDIISMGRTQLVFIPFCGEEFDWSDLPLGKK